MSIITKVKQYFYDKKFNKFIKDMGAYEDVLLLQGSDYEYCVASMKVQEIGFYAKQSPKVIAMLIMDASKKYESNRELSILFLEALYKKFALEAIKIGVPNIIPPKELGLEEKEESYHGQLDKAVSYCSGFLKSISTLKNENDSYCYDLCAEIIVYIATFVHVHAHGIDIPPMYWNTFKAGIENRMLSIKNDGSPRSGLINTPNGQAFASFVSGYFKKMDRLEENIWAMENHDNKSLSSVVMSFLESEFDINISPIGQFELLLWNVGNMVSKEIIPVIVRVFELEN